MSDTGGLRFDGERIFSVGIYFSVCAFIVGKYVSDGKFALNWNFLSLFPIVLFVTLDGAVRYHSRKLVKSDPYPGSNHIDYLIIAFELIGAITICMFAREFISKVDLTTLPDYGFVYGFFCGTTSMYNALLIVRDKSIKLGGYFHAALLKDASEIPSTSRRWGGFLLQVKDNLLVKIGIKLEDLKKVDVFKDFKALSKPIDLSACIFTGIFKLAIIHFFFQLAALHLVVLNFITGIGIVFYLSLKPFHDDMVRIFPNYSMILFFQVAMVIICFMLSSWEEMNRHSKLNSLRKRETMEKIFQGLGNIIVIISILAIYLRCSYHGLIAVSVGQQTIVGILLLYEHKKKQNGEE